MTADSRLTIELVPGTMWHSNLRSMLPKSDWDRLRRATYKRANYRCEVCDGCGPEWPVECHEVWEYDDKCFIQRLKGLVALCPSCHEVKHIGYAKVRGKLYPAAEHLQKVNRWDGARTRLYIFDAFAEWDRRSRHRWKQDLSWLNSILGKEEERSK